MRNTDNVETARWAVSNDTTSQNNEAMKQNGGAPTKRSVGANSGPADGQRTDLETPHRGVSTSASPLFKNRYRVSSARLPHWNYAANAYYFVTICTWNREPTLGYVVDGTVNLSLAGEIARNEWRHTADVRPYVLVDEFVVMPNHVHGILAIDRQRDAQDSWQESPEARLQSGSLSAIIGQFKSVCTKAIRKAGTPDFGWQDRFYEQVIRDEGSLNRIRQYVIDNPSKWTDDPDVPQNLWM